MRILDQKERIPCYKDELIEKVFWRDHDAEEMIWEFKELMQELYPTFSIDRHEFRGRNFLRGGDCNDPDPNYTIINLFMVIQ